MADIPGIIEGAAEGKGLGLRFLRHIERNSILLFMIPADSESIENEYKILLTELLNYNPELLDKKRILAITKCDLVDDEIIESLKPQIPDIPNVFISAVANKGITELKDLIWNAITTDNEVEAKTNEIDDNSEIQTNENWDFQPNIDNNTDDDQNNDIVE